MKQYPRLHAERGNLLIHLLAVPVFVAGAVVLAVAGWRGELGLAAAGLGAMVVSIAAQRFGHRRETTPPPPFSSPADFFVRIFREQFFTFPLFVLRGGWWRNWRAAGARDTAD